MSPSAASSPRPTGPKKSNESTDSEAPAPNQAGQHDSSNQGLFDRWKKSKSGSESRHYARLDVPLLDAIGSLRELANDLWPKLVQRGSRSGPTRYLFVSPRRNSGTTLVTASAGLGLARNLREPVVLAELNTERPALASYLAAGEGPGVGELLAGAAEPGYCRIEVGDLDRLQVFAAGEPRVLSPGDFAHERMDRVARDFEARGQYVLYDAPPLLEYPGSLLMVDQVDGVVLVVRGRETEKPDLDRCMELLDQAGAKVAGMIFNRYESDLPFGLGSV